MWDGRDGIGRGHTGTVVVHSVKVGAQVFALLFLKMKICILYSLLYR